MVREKSTAISKLADFLVLSSRSYFALALILKYNDSVDRKKGENALVSFERNQTKNYVTKRMLIFDDT